MAIAADRNGPRDGDRDDAADASRFFSRIGYLVLGVGAPVGIARLSIQTMPPSLGTT